jgi:HD-GYP domain-containing protein (c-di-GMP phosphodiesterase class II)
MILGKNVYTADGRILLRQGTVLSERYIKALRDLQFTYVYVRDSRVPDLEVDDVIPENLRQEAIQVIHRSFGDIQAQFSRSGSQKSGLNIDSIADITKNIVESILTNKDLIIQLSDLKSHDNYTFSHSVNVCVVGTVLGHKLGFSDGRLRDLAIGLILHDIGKTTIEPTILHKTGKLTENEFDQMKEHARNGFDLLREISRLSAHSKIVVLQHHERFDGTGYPKGLKGQDIHQYGQIGAIADVYDALTSDRTYRKRLLPHEAIEFLMGAADRYFALDLVSTFVGSIAPYPVGTVVKLSTGETAIVTDVDMALASRPAVRVVQDPSGKNNKPPFPSIALKTERGITITKVIAD